jgi:CheY-like chemotaxis protein
LITGKRINSDGEENPEIDVFVRGTRFMWFAPSVGLIKVKYNHEEGSATEISLIGYSIKKSDRSYFPLALGNIWHYEWVDTYSEYMNYEIWRVAEKKKGSYNIRCFNRVSRLKGMVSIEQEAPEKKRILLVSNKEAELESLKELLLDEDHDVTAAISGSEALSTMRDSLFDVVAIDDLVTTREKTSEMSGMELLQKIKQLSPYPQVIVMMEFTTVDRVIKMMRHGAYDVIERPLSPEKFIASIRQAIEKAKAT